ncbi:MAG: 2-oxo acid dehydrogenase subunit E2 [Phycisphaerales bacterium]|nr:2-oxo acid dehydrogenase subunit E2 [Phycisphaerales bacterium]
MPRLSDTMEQGTIVHWNVKEGDAVKPGVVLGDIETDKATMELQAFDAGVVAAILLPEGKPAAIGTLMLAIAEDGEDPAAVKARFSGGAAAATAIGAAATSRPAAKVASAGGAPTASGVAVLEHTNGGGHGAGARVFASPLARKIAEERGLDLAAITGTGPAGRIVRRDVEAAVETKPAPAARAAQPAAPRGPSIVTAVAGPSLSSELAGAAGALQDRDLPLSNMRRTIARRLVESKQGIPHYQVTVAVSMDKLLDLREQLNDQLAAQGVKLSVNDFIVRACALAMHKHPSVNASFASDGGSIRQHAAVNVGVAIALPVNPDGSGGGLVVATIRNADHLGLRAISTQTKAFAEKARGKGLSVEDMADSTFTISNLGMFGVEHFTAIINPPNSAILAVGAAVKKPVVRDDQIVIGHEMQMTMSSDHRVIDGAMAAQYLSTVRAMLEAPATLLV